jgi:hypothetical protein
MKQLILLGISILLIGKLSAQVCEITQVGSTTPLNGTVITHTVTNGNDSNLEFHFKNIDTVDHYWKITRKFVSAIPANWTDYLCWGIEGEIGQCYSSSASDPWVAPDALTTYDAMFNPISGLPVGGSGLAAIHWDPDMCGTATYRYYVHDNGGAYQDSVDVKVVYGCLSVQDDEAVSLSFYPNPASSVLTINAEGLEKFDIRIVDVLGKVVYTDSAMKTKKIDVSDLKNGVYIVTIMDKGMAIQTKRIVIKH